MSTIYIISNSKRSTARVQTDKVTSICPSEPPGHHHIVCNIIINFHPHTPLSCLVPLSSGVEYKSRIFTLMCRSRCGAVSLRASDNSHRDGERENTKRCAANKYEYLLPLIIYETRRPTKRDPATKYGGANKPIWMVIVCPAISSIEHTNFITQPNERRVALLNPWKQRITHVTRSWTGWMYMVIDGGGSNVIN